LTFGTAQKTKNRKFALQSSFMDQQLSVLLISGWYPNRTNPTLGNFNEKFARSTALYCKVDVIHVVADSGMDLPVECIDQESEGVHAHYVYFRKKYHEGVVDKVIKKLKYFWYYHKAFRRLVKENGQKPNLVHVHVLYPAGVFALFLKWFYRLPYVVTEHWTGYLPGSFVAQSRARMWLSRVVARNAALLLPVTENLKQAMQSLGFKSLYEVVPNVFDVRDFGLPEKTHTPTVQQILHVSSLRDDHKNISGLLRATKKLSELRQDFELHIVGDGDATPHLQLAEELGLLNRFVRFSGEMSPAEVAATMRSSDFFVLFSNYENLPCVIVEAFASGLPVISTKVGGISEHLDTTKGLLIQPGEEDALLQAMLYMIDHNKQYDKQMMHQYALDHFSYESVGKGLDTLYREVLK
jgi:glycosyltransferase involved in cell wall biosynthesis